MSIIVNNKAIKTFNFSGGECHVSVQGIDITSTTTIEAYLYSSDSIMQLLMVVDAIRQKNPDTKIHLTIPYFPYARQDRVCNQGEAFSAAVMTRLVNGLECEMVTVFDPHSEVVVNQVQNCKVVSQADIVEGTALAKTIQQQNLTLVSPDKGAKYKTAEVAKRLGADVIYCQKTRDTATGQITQTVVNGNVSGKNLIILDDICDGGRTFIELAKVLHAKGADDLSLYVTHGIFSKGLEVLREHFTYVYCHHTMLDDQQIDHEFLTVLGEAK